MKPVVQVKELETTFFLKSGPFRAVNRISYEINKGETLGIVGESGCGKSVTSFSLMRLIERPGKVTHGQFFLNDQEILSLNESQMEGVRGGKMAMIFQEPMTALNPVLTIGYQMDEQIQKHLKYSKKDSRDRAIEMLQLVGIPSAKDRYHAYPHQLSGGMRQRAMIAMALSCNPQFLIADEPTTALDVTIQAQILELFQSLQEKMNMTVQFITHDLGVISEISDKIMVMYGGHTCETGATQDILNSPLHPYTGALIASRPKLGHRVSRLKTIEGSVPAPHELPKGCPFSNRCSRVKTECWTNKPVLTPIVNQPGRAVACFNPL
ncbi:ABC transporter ATP-binding protein [Pseudobdellovibrio exovorus]|uniref:Putative oligopeptide transport system ATP-binding protein n=1 Tax=Pseudobdellovibrio exovorus JSS TaxID=1184267 RepID=M4VC59_9BACT|nr:ABC transporter ATP-binding protein [Pseudobdellovibrio exovorus]AGH95616.1 putative oligopeptide transport system ATP-binding protein [Pseudobdellovibrio exovorus JSS]